MYVADVSRGCGEYVDFSKFKCVRVIFKACKDLFWFVWQACSGNVDKAFVVLDV